MQNGRGGATPLTLETARHIARKKRSKGEVTGVASHLFSMSPEQRRSRRIVSWATPSGIQYLGRSTVIHTS